jgi:pyruvate formate lyase activating enzyme
MQIKGFIDTTFLDWDGKVACTVFTPGCNLRCPFCHNHGLVLNPEQYEDVKEEEIFDFLTKHNDFIDGVCITGGEPTLQKGLDKFCERVKKLGIKIKLDTNGTNPTVVRRLLEKDLVDYIAMDIKAPLNEEQYSEVSGVRCEVDKIRESVNLIKNSGVEYEFRTTVVPSLHTFRDIEQISRDIKGAKLYVLQKFQPRFAMDRGLRNSRVLSDDDMKKLVKIISCNVDKAFFRGK